MSFLGRESGRYYYQKQRGKGLSKYFLESTKLLLKYAKKHSLKTLDAI